MRRIEVQRLAHGGFRFLWTQKAPTGDAAKDAGEKKKLAVVTNDPALREVGVLVQKNDKGDYVCK